MTKDKTVTIPLELAERLDSPHSSVRNSALESLRRIIAAPLVERQPVAWMVGSGVWMNEKDAVKYAEGRDVIPLYSAPTDNFVLDLPLRKTKKSIVSDRDFCVGWNEYDSELKRRNPQLVTGENTVAEIKLVPPDGWKLVPIIPTLEMKRAGLTERHDDLAADIYRAMLEIAPACLDKVKEMNR